MEVFQARLTGRGLGCRPRTHSWDYIFYLAWEHPWIPQEELEEVAREVHLDYFALAAAITLDKQ